MRDGVIDGVKKAAEDGVSHSLIGLVLAWVSVPPPVRQDRWQTVGCPVENWG